MNWCITSASSRKLQPERLREAVDWIERYRAMCERNYQRLDALLKDLQGK